VTLRKQAADVNSSLTLDRVLHGTNSFNAVRLLCALAVVLSHGLQLFTGSRTADPLSWAAYNLGSVAVNVFFFLSGMMLARSYEMNPRPVHFLISRALRIFPALLMSGVVVAIFIAPFGTHHYFGWYFLDPQTWFFPLATALLYERAQLVDVFAYGSWAGEINVPLWTVKYEIFAYVCFTAAAALGLLKGARLVVIGLVAITVPFVALDFSVLGESPVGSILRFGFAFILGICAFKFAPRIRYSWSVAGLLLLLALVLDDTVLGRSLSVIAFAYAALVLGSCRIPGLTEETNRRDLSFGLYLYAWPIQQALLHFVSENGLGLPAYLVLSLLFAGVLAALSWHLVERPALELKHGLRARLALKA
jgi:peptidoglycan/LPS O-acetylase OafA/YrhL